MSKATCNAQYHSKDELDSLPFSSNTLFCELAAGHEGGHRFYGGGVSTIDNAEDCDCPRCKPVKN